MKYIDILKKFDNAIITESLKLKKIYENIKLLIADIYY